MIYAVFIGGGLGAVVRYLFSILFSKHTFFIPYHTLLANFTGCLIAGIVITVFTLKSHLNPIYKTLLITGFCGGLTTFSTFSLETVEYIHAGEYAKAFLYTMTSFSVCIISVLLGIVTAKTLIR